MRVVFQRVYNARVTVAGRTVGEIGRGALLLCGVGEGDTKSDACLCAKKSAELRVFEDENGRMNLSLTDIGGDALVVSNFTLYGDCRRGRRPDFTDAAKPPEAKRLYEGFVEALRENGVGRVETGEFGADMRIDMAADGPVTLLVDSARLTAPRRGEAGI
ncbi:MAG: D-aminoacyl-tRNA deacylase [Acutalibacteraceae bacterium]